MNFPHSHNFGIIFVLAILVGLLYVLPPIYVWKNLNLNGQSFVLAQLETYKDEIKDYLPRAREVYDGHIPPNDAYFDEQRPTVLNPLPPILFSLFIFLSKGDINFAYLYAQFFLSGVIFLLFYFLGVCLFRSKLPSIFFAMVGILTPLSALFYRWGLNGNAFESFKEIILVTVKQFIPIVRTQTHKMYLARIDDPLLTYLFFLPAILFFFKFWLEPKKKYFIPAGIFAGSLFYVYFHYWVIWAVTVFVLFLYSLYFHKEDLERVKNFLILLGIWAVVSIPYFISYFKASSFSDYNNFVYRFGVYVGRGWDVVWQLKLYYPVYFLIMIVVYLFYFKYKKEKEKAILFLGCCLAMFVSPNLQLLTGFMPIPGQSTKAAALLLFIIISSVVYDLSKSFLEKKPLLKKSVLFLLILSIIIVPVKKIVNAFSFENPSTDILKSYSFPKDTFNSWGWINKNLIGEPKIISSSPVTSVYLSTYTSARPFLAAGFVSSMPIGFLEDRFLLSNKFFKVDPEMFKKRLEEIVDFQCGDNCPKDGWTNLNKSIRFIYINYFTSGKSVLKSSPMPQEYLDGLVEKYKSIVVKNNSDIAADYVYYGILEKQFSQPDFIDNKDLTLVFTNPSVSIYKINR